MPIAASNFSAAAIYQLQNEIKTKTENQFRSLKDCNTFSEDLANNYRIIISGHTLARIFKIIPSNSAPSLYTLDKLSEYCGYRDWNHFTKNNNESLRFAEESFKRADHKEFCNKDELLLLRFCLDGQAFAPALKYLNKISDNLNVDFSLETWLLAETLGVSLRNDPIARKQFFPELIKDERIRSIVFNYWVDMDELNTYYADLIKDNFLKTVGRHDENYIIKNIWAKTIDLYAALYRLDQKNFVKIAYNLFREHKLIDISYENILHYYPSTRYRSCLIIYKYLSEPTTSSAWYETQVVEIKNIIKHVDEYYQTFITPLIIEALFLCKKYDLILWFMDEYDAMLARNVLKDGTIITEGHSTYKTIYYFHLTAFLQRDFDSKTFSKVFKFPLGNNEWECVDNMYTNRFMNLIVQSLYPENINIKAHLLKEATSIAKRIKNKLFLSHISLIG